MSDYIKIGDAGVIARNQISLVRRNSNFIEVLAAGLTNPVTFRFESVDAAQKVLANVLRQLDSDGVINVPKKPVWLNIYLLSNGSYSVCEHTSRAAAESAVDETNRLVACLEI